VGLCPHQHQSFTDGSQLFLQLHDLPQLLWKKKEEEEEAEEAN